MRIRAWKPISQIQISVVCLLEAEILPGVNECACACACFAFERMCVWWGGKGGQQGRNMMRGPCSADTGEIFAGCDVWT